MHLYRARGPLLCQIREHSYFRVSSALTRTRAYACTYDPYGVDFGASGASRFKTPVHIRKTARTRGCEQGASRGASRGASTAKDTPSPALAVGVDESDPRGRALGERDWVLPADLRQLDSPPRDGQRCPSEGVRELTREKIRKNETPRTRIRDSAKMREADTAEVHDGAPGRVVAEVRRFVLSVFRSPFARLGPGRMPA